MSISSETNPINERMIPKNEKIDMQLKADVAYDYDKFAKLYRNLSLQINVGSTQHEVSLENRLYRLLHYRPIFNRPIKTPILIVYALINRSYILDLQPDKSWIRNLLYQGFDIYLIDWKPPSQNDKYVTFDDYVNYFIDDCVDHVRDKSSIDKITLHGYCMGATMSTMYCSLHQHKLRNLVTIAPVIDTSKDHTVIGNFAKHLDIDKIINSSGNLPPELLRSCFAALKPYKQGINKYFTLMEHIDNKNFVENFLRIEKWLDDIPAITGETSRQWIKDIYQNNLLAKNEMRLDNKLVDLSKINIPLLNLVADQDHLVTPTCSIPLNDLVSSTDNRLMKFPTGHVGMIASSYSQNFVLPKVGRWFFMRS